MTRRPVPTPAWRTIDNIAAELAPDVAVMGDAELAGTLLACLRVLGARTGHQKATRLALGLALRAAQANGAAFDLPQHSRR